MYLGEKLYKCDICAFQEDWDATDDVHGDLWSCETCGRTFCSKCFKDALGEEAYSSMMQDFNIIRCPVCYSKRFRSKISPIKLPLDSVLLPKGEAAQ